MLFSQKITLTRPIDCGTAIFGIRPIDCGTAIFGISKAYMVSMWYKLIDKFGADNLHLIFMDTDSLAFELTGKNYKEADLIYHHIKEDT